MYVQAQSSAWHVTGAPSVLSITSLPLASSRSVEHSGSWRVWPKELRSWHQGTFFSRVSPCEFHVASGLGRDVCEDREAGGELWLWLSCDSCLISKGPRACPIT